jgi:hypothetical protein
LPSPSTTKYFAGATASRDGKSVYVFNEPLYVNASSSTLSVISTATNAVVQSVGVEELGDFHSDRVDLPISPDGSHLYVYGAEDYHFTQDLQVIGISNQTVTSIDRFAMPSSIPFPDDSLVIAPDGRYLFGVNVFATGAIVRTDLTTRTPELWNNTETPMNPFAVAISPRGNELYVGYVPNPPSSCHPMTPCPSPYVLVLDAATGTRIAKIETGVAWALVVSPDGNTLYAQGNDQIKVIDVASRTVVDTFQLAGNATGLAVSADGRLLVTSLGDRIAIVDTVKKTVATVQTSVAGLVVTRSAIATATPTPAIEFYHAGLDHYFITADPAEIADLDLGRHVGWGRTGLTIPVFPKATAGASPVCRFYIPPAFGDSHFYSASPSECNEVKAKFPQLMFEAPDVFYIDLPNATTGACPAGEIPVYRFWNGRADSNHRYTTSTDIVSLMEARGYVSEGYGPNGVAMCAVGG